jgi:hypothetical protein
LDQKKILKFWALPAIDDIEEDFEILSSCRNRGENQVVTLFVRKKVALNRTP